MARGLRKILHWFVPERVWHKISLRGALRCLSPRYLWRQMVPEGKSCWSQFGQWYHESGYWYATSVVVHGIGFFILAIVLPPWPGQGTSLVLPDPPRGVVLG